MLTKQNVENILEHEVVSNSKIDQLFNCFENQMLDMKEIVIDMGKTTFISTYFLEKLEQLVEKARELNAQVKIINVKSTIYKVFQVARVNNILNICS